VLETDMNLFELIKHRRSIRKYEDRQVPREDLERIIEAGLYAPNADKILDAHFPQCPIRNVIARIGDRWSILILLTLEPAKEPMRFKELEQAIYQQPHRLKVVPSVNTKVW
jgi:nitroreductase